MLDIIVTLINAIINGGADLIGLVADTIGGSSTAE